MGEWVQQSMNELDLQEAVFTSAVAHELRFTLLGHRDPGDRFLVATAKVYGLTLVTADEGLRLLQIAGLQMLMSTNRPRRLFAVQPDPPALLRCAFPASRPYTVFV